MINISCATLLSFPSDQMTTNELGQYTKMICFMLIRVIILAVAATGPASCCEYLITSPTLPVDSNARNISENIVFSLDTDLNRKQLLLVCSNI